MIPPPAETDTEAATPTTITSEVLSASRVIAPSTSTEEDDLMYVIAKKTTPASDVAERAPMYFKKAIDEAESEWSTHDSKKCISTAPPKGLRGAVPPNFPYFHVEFNMAGGFVHVIDDDDKWRVDFGRDVLIGLLDLPENTTRAKKRPLPHLPNPNLVPQNFEYIL